jgi:5'-3' exonuclease
MLSLLHLSYTKNIHLYRETKYFSYMKGIDPEIDYLFNMYEMGSKINEIMNKDQNNEYENKDVLINIFNQNIKNYCFLCFLCGNDFLPHFPSINIRNNGIDYLLEVYKVITKNKNSNIDFVDGNKIIWQSFHLFCSEVSNKEIELINMNIEWKKRMASYSHPLTIEESLEAVPLKDLKREIYITTNMDKYYPYLFNNNEKDVCTNYLQMLEWTWNYYNGTCKNNYMCYEFHSGPLFSSLKKYIPCFDEELVHQDKCKLPSSISQLLYVLPYDDYNLIPIKIEFSKFSKLIDKEYINLTETNFPIHFDFCKFFWEGYVDFNYIDLKRLDYTVNKWKL